MEEASLYNKMQYYLFYGLAVILVLLSIVSYNIWVVLLALLCSLISVILLHSGHILNNLLIKKSKVIEVKNGYKLSQNLISASKRHGKSYHAVAIANLIQRNNFNYKSDSMKELIESTKEPFEFTLSLTEVDKKRMLESLETKRRVKEIALSRLKPNSYDKVNNIRRQIEAVDNEITNLKSSGKSFDVEIQLKAISNSENEYEAEIDAAKSIEILANKFSSSIGVDYEILKGEELMNFI